MTACCVLTQIWDTTARKERTFFFFLGDIFLPIFVPHLVAGIISYTDCGDGLVVPISRVSVFEKGDILIPYLLDQLYFPSLMLQ